MKLSAALSFAHLGGLARKAAAASAEDDEDKKEQDREDTNAKGTKAQGDDDERKKRDDESDDEYAARMKALDDEEDEKEKANSKAQADDDEDKDEEMRGQSAIARGRLREQARCAAIFASRAAALNPVMAANLAFKTRMPRREALALLEGTPAPASSAAQNPARAARNPGIAAGGAMEPTGAQAIAASWDRAFAKVHPKRH